MSEYHHHFHYHVHDDRIRRIENVLERVEASLVALHRKVEDMSASINAKLDEVEAVVTEIQGVIPSVVALLEQLHAIAVGDGTAEARLETLKGILADGKDRLAAGVAANPVP